MLPTRGPLTIHPENPRVFADRDGRGVYLTGSHTWAVIQDIGRPDGEPFPFDTYLGLLGEWNHNFSRLWVWEHPEGGCWTDTRMVFAPVPWARTGPGLAADGLPKFNLDVWDEQFFERLRSRVIACRDAGIYVSVMLFQGWSLKKVGGTKTDPWEFHPFNRQNNVNGIDVPFGGADDDEHPCLHSLKNPEVLAKQEAYVRHTVELLNDLDNVMYEVINEGGTKEWQYHILRFVKEVEAGLPQRHLTGMTHRIAPLMFNQDLFDSPADWISPAKEPLDFLYPGSVLVEDYQEDPPAADGRKIILNDTDHLWGHGGHWRWAWKSFTRGHHVLFMDPWWPLYLDSTPENAGWVFTGGVTKDQPDYPDFEPLRRTMGDTLRLADRVDMARSVPRGSLSSTGYCLADPGVSYIVYAPTGGRVTLDLREAVGKTFSVEWFVPILSRTFPTQIVAKGGDYFVTDTPFSGDAVLFLRAAATG